jgi:hypothetical protein
MGPDVPKNPARDTQLKELRKKLADLDATLPPYTQAMTVAVNRTAAKPYIAVGGDFKTKGAEVEPGVPPS